MVESSLTHNFLFRNDFTAVSENELNAQTIARMVPMTNNTNVGPQYALTFSYDPKGRRIQKLVVSNSVSLYTNTFLYDGWNLVSILNSPSSIFESFLWGSDLSGSQQGAGGVGGLLEVSCYGTSTTNCFPAYDGNGNVSALINAADGTLAANYDYGPFGEPIRMTGTMGKVNPFRFSTKYNDDESDLLYYGYRYYKPDTGTWLNRDPIEERGSFNLYSFVKNSPENKIDMKGTDINDPPPVVTSPQHICGWMGNIPVWCNPPSNPSGPPPCPPSPDSCWGNCPQTNYDIFGFFQGQQNLHGLMRC
ncbi:MAG TPA: RHS repeat-associated core domain-containing protein [Verrucomicrobiae bacterium]|jgi:RHS repeat-associated protein